MNISTLVILLQAIQYLFVFLLLIGLVFGTYYLFLRSELHWPHIRLIVGVTAFSYLASTILSWIIYPFFLPGLRQSIIDTNLPHATGLFLIKDHLSAIGIIIALALIVISLFGRLGRASIQRHQLYGSLFATLGLMTIMLVVVAFMLNSLR
jgi:hypothetical protein